MSLKPHPVAAFILSLLGGVIITFSSLFVIVIGSAITFFIGGVGGYIGLLGLLCGSVIIFYSLKLRTDPKTHTISGSIIIIASFISWIVAVGGFGIGFLLALFGGILGLIWRPPNNRQ
ncbi:hypothetical protein JW865_08990 [Candidatus Bathyarchaeota archaeon]|nr:hypothetical protein [Candidatus Bathyarchaeota archaeon]